MNLPRFARALGAQEEQEAQRLHDDLIGEIAPFVGGDQAPLLECARVLNVQGGINWSEPAHLHALRVASGEREAYLVGSPELELSHLAVDLDGLTAFVASNDLVDPDVFEQLTAAWDPAVIELLAPGFVDRWTLVSQSGGWIFSTWNAGDLSALAGSAAFIQGYADARPSAPLDAVTWLIGEGETAASEDKGLAAIAQLRKNITHVDFMFTLSPLYGYLTEIYGEEAAEFLWEVSERIRRTDTRRGLTAHEANTPLNPGVPAPRVPGAEVAEFLDSSMTRSGTADQRLDRLLSLDSQLHSQLTAIWAARN